VTFRESDFPGKCP